MPRHFRILTLFVLLPAFQLSCKLSTSTATPEPTPSPTTAQTPTPTPIPGPHGQIAYGSMSTGGGQTQVVLMDLDSGDVTSLTENFTGEFNRPVWSPDGSKLAMRGEITSSAGGIAVMDVLLQDGRPIGSAPVSLVSQFADSPTWSPDGSRVAYVTTGNSGHWTSYTTGLTGSSQESIPGIPPGATDLAWSPDGEWIAFTWYADSPHQIHDLYKIHPDGTGLLRLTSTPDADEDMPAWSPDGAQIAYSYRGRPESEVGQRDIYRMNADGSGIERVTGDKADEFDPAWSPDGAQIAFTSTRNEAGDSNYEIYIINIDGTGELRLTNNSVTDRWPTWRRTPAGTSYADCRAGAKFIDDVTIPEGTRFASPQKYSKVWRIQNDGDCGWAPAGYGLRFADGETMSGPAYLPLSGAIQPGETVDLALELTAPDSPGAHRGKWTLFDNAGRPVPGPDGNPLTLAVGIETAAPSNSTLPSPLYFRSERGGSWQIWRLETDGATFRQISNESVPVGPFDVSPADGSLAFVSGTQLILTDRDGGNRRVVAEFGEIRGGSPAWSPDGRLAYAWNGIHVYQPATGEDRLLKANGSTQSMGGIAIYSPRSFSPDGSKLLAAVGYYEGSDLAILSAADGAELAHAPYTGMYAWTGNGLALYLASATYPMMSGMDPGLQWVTTAGTLAPLIKNAFVWWPYQRPGAQLVYFVSRPAGMTVSQYAVTMSIAAADAGGERALRVRPIPLDVRDSFIAAWTADGSAAVVRIVRPASGSREVLILPAGDGPAVFLSADGSEWHWG